MRIFHSFDNLPQFCDPIISVGSYDGVHAGHRVLLKRISEQAQSSGKESIIITFSPHPRTVLDPETKAVPLLNSLKEKILLLEELGIDNLIIAPFTREFSMVSSYDFVRHYLIERLHVGTLIIGYNHHFGHNKQGNFDYLYALQDEFRFQICEVPRQEVDNDKVSSTVVRHQIERGDMRGAAHSLTRPYFMIAQMDEQGTLTPDDPNKLLPQEGTYSVTVGGQPTQLTIGSGRIILTPKPQVELHTDFIVTFD